MLVCGFLLKIFQKEYNENMDLLSNSCSAKHVHMIKKCIPIKSACYHYLQQVVHTGTFAKIYFIPLLYHPVCPEKRTSSRNYNLFVRSDVFQPKWNDIRKNIKKYQNPVKSYCFFGCFQQFSVKVAVFLKCYMN